MKGTAIAFNILGMVLSITYYLSQLDAAIYYGIGWLYYLMIVLSIAFGLSALITLFTNKKRVFIGVMALLFNGLIGGILYLCWQPRVKSRY